MFSAATLVISEVNGAGEGREASGASEISGAIGTGLGAGTADAPTASAMRRALARARDGKPLDLDEATVLLHARGEDLQTLLSYAAAPATPAWRPRNGPGSSPTRARSSSR